MWYLIYESKGFKNKVSNNKQSCQMDYIISLSPRSFLKPVSVENISIIIAHLVVFLLNIHAFFYLSYYLYDQQFFTC